MSLDRYHALTHASGCLAEALSWLQSGGLVETEEELAEIGSLSDRIGEEQRKILETCAAEDSGPVLEVLQSELGRRGGARMQGWRVDLMIQLEEREAEPHPSLSDADRNPGLA